MLSETGTRWHRAPGPPARRLANRLQMASSYREGREWSCECHYCRLLAGVRHYLAHHGARGPVAFAISAGRSNAAAMEVWQDNAADGGDLRSYAPQVVIELVSKRLKERRKCDAAARALGKGAGRFNVAPAVEGCLRCRSANQAGWRSENPLPELADHPHGARAPTFSSSPGSAGRRRWGGRRAVSDRRAEPGRDVRQGVTVHPGSRCRAGCRRGAVGNRETNSTGGSDR